MRIIPGETSYFRHSNNIHTARASLQKRLIELQWKWWLQVLFRQQETNMNISKIFLDRTCTLTLILSSQLGAQIKLRSRKIGGEEVVNLSSPVIIHTHHLIKKHQIYSFGELNSWELYCMQSLLTEEKPTSQKYYEKIIWFSIKGYLYLTAASNEWYKALHFSVQIIAPCFMFELYALQFGKAVSLLCSFSWKNLIPQDIFFIIVQRRTFFSLSYYFHAKIYEQSPY